MLDEKILVTGGKGLLATNLKKHFPKATFVDKDEFDITNYQMMENYLSEKNVKLIIHCAAYTSVAEAEKNIDILLDTNIIGAANVVKICAKNGIKLVYISTDYVFSGDKGLYKEDDPLLPVNKYAWSKLGGECAAHLYENSLIIRTSFGSNPFPYPSAFVDQWTSREKVSVVAKKIAELIKKGATGIFHVGGERKTVYEFAKSIDPSKDIGKRSIKELDVKLPKDTSLDTTKFEKFFEAQ